VRAADLEQDISRHHDFNLAFLNYDDREVQQYLNELSDLEKQRKDGRSCFEHERDKAGYRYSQSEKGMLEHFSQSHPDVSRWAQLRDEEYTKLLGDAYRSEEAATAGRKRNWKD
jgi:hypothetical protein